MPNPSQDRIENAHIELGEQLGLIISNNVVQDETTGELGLRVIMHSWSDAPFSFETGPVHTTRCGLDVHDDLGVHPMVLEKVTTACEVCKVSEEELAKGNALIESWRTM